MDKFDSLPRIEPPFDLPQDKDNMSFFTSLRRLCTHNPGFVAGSVISGSVAGYGAGFFFLDAPTPAIRHKLALFLGIPIVLPGGFAASVNLKLAHDIENSSVIHPERLIEQPIELPPFQLMAVVLLLCNSHQRLPIEREKEDK